MKNKKFDPALYEKYDQSAKETAIQFFENHGYSAIENTDLYGPDLLVYKGEDFAGYAECEVRAVWQGNEFPYETLSLPYRKEKFLDLAESEEAKILFLVINADFTTLAKVKGQAVAQAPVVERSTRLSQQVEKFFDISLEDVVFYEIDKEAA